MSDGPGEDGRLRPPAAGAVRRRRRRIYRYGHLFPDELDDVARRMDEAARQAGVYITCTEADPALFPADGQVTENAV